MSKTNNITHNTDDGRMSKVQQAKQTVDEAIATLAQELQNGKSETLIRFLNMLSRFHSYSFGNVMLIMSQRPDATHVAGYRTWQKLGRQVRKGEKGITIIAPMLLKKESNDGGEPERFLRFKAASVFDISQTDGDELPAPLEMQGDPGTHLPRLRAFVESLSITLEFADCGLAHGVSRGGHIVIQPGMSDAETFSTLVHELAHEMLHHGNGAARGTKQTRELEAEAVAHVVCTAVGLQPGTACSDYLHTYGCDAEMLADVLDRVQRTAAIILDGLFADASEESRGVAAVAHA